MKNTFVLVATSLVVPILLVGCYTQLGHYTVSRTGPREAGRIDDVRTLNENQEEGNDHTGIDRQTETEEDEGYYGRRGRTYDRYIPYYDGYYFSDPYPYYGYYSTYYPYYRNYGYWAPYRHGRRRYRQYVPRYYKNRDFHHGKKRSRSHRGVDSRRSSSDRPIRKADIESNPTSPNEDNSRRGESRMYKRRR